MTTPVEDARAALAFWNAHPDSPSGYLASAMESLIAEHEQAVKDRDDWQDEAQRLSNFLDEATAHFAIQEGRIREARADVERLTAPPTDDEREEPDLPNGHAPAERLSPFLARRIRDNGCQVPTGEWTTERIREAFIYDGGEAEYHDPINGAREQRRVAGAIFDAWLTAHDAALRRQAPLTDDEREAKVEAALLALMQSPDVPTGVRPHLLGGEVLVIRERCDAEPIARAVLDAAGFRRQGPITDERELFDVIADRLGEHSQARNYEIADSGEYETKLRGPIDVESLAEWLTPVLARYRRQGPITDEWEYGAVYQGHNGAWFSMDGAFALREAAEREVERYADAQITLGRRRKADPWEPVEAAERARTTNQPNGDQ